MEGLELAPLISDPDTSQCFVDLNIIVEFQSSAICSSLYVEVMHLSWLTWS